LEHAFPSGLLSAAAWLETGLLAIGLVAVMVGLLRANASTAQRREVRLRSTGLLLWLALPVILTIRHSFPVQVHYLLVVYPAPFIVIGAATSWLLRLGSSARIIATGLIAVVVAVAAVQASAAASAIQYLAVTEDVCYGTTLR